MTRRRVSHVIITSAVLVLSGCTSTPSPDDSKAPSPSTTIALPSEEDIEAYAATSCDDLIPADLVRTLSTGGLSVDGAEPWNGNDVSFADGIVCRWEGADGVPTTFAWAQATDQEVEAAKANLDAAGWRSETHEGGTILYVDPGTERTYVFGSTGEVRYGSTLEGAKAVMSPR